MSEKLNYLECWTSVASSLFAQALAGEPALTESLPKPMGPRAFGFAATLEGAEEGRFSVLLDGSLIEAPLLGEGVDQKAGWAELLKEVADAAAGELLAKTGRETRVTSFVPIEAETKLTRAFLLKAGDRTWPIQVNNTVRAPKSQASTSEKAAPEQGRPVGPAKSGSDGVTTKPGIQHGSPPTGEPKLSAGLELLLDVELEASLRFGSREMPLGEILGLGPGDVVQLDRHISDPVELIVGDKIVARGEVVLIDGNFGLKIIQVAAPQSRLESIRCLF